MKILFIYQIFFNIKKREDVKVEMNSSESKRITIYLQKNMDYPSDAVVFFNRGTVFEDYRENILDRLRKNHIIHSDYLQWIRKMLYQKNLSEIIHNLNKIGDSGILYNSKISKEEYGKTINYAIYETIIQMGYREWNEYEKKEDREMLNNPYHIFFIIVYLQPDDIYTITHKIFHFVMKEPIKNTVILHNIHYKLLVSLYLIIMSREDMKENFFNNKDCDKLYMEFKSLIEKLYKEDIIKNPIFFRGDTKKLEIKEDNIHFMDEDDEEEEEEEEEDEEDEEDEEEEEEEFEEWFDEDIEDEREEEERGTLSVEDNKILTLYDLWIHSFYIHRNMYLFMVFFDIIIEHMKKMNDEDYQKVYNLNTNTVNLRYLNNITDNTNGHFIYYINKSIEQNSIYNDTFLYYIFEPYRFLITKKKNYSYYTLDTLTMKFYIKKFFDEVFFVRDLCDYLNFQKDEDRIMQNLYQIVRDIHLYESMIGGCRYYHYWIDKFKREEEGKIPLVRNFFIMIFLRYIDYKMNKYGRSSIHFDIKEDYYSIKVNNKIVTLKKEDYMNLIDSFLQSVDKKTRDFIYNTMDDFLNHQFKELKKMEERVEEKICSICLDNTDDFKDRAICIHCKHLFHESCINQFFIKNGDNCPTCRRYILSSFYLFSEVKYHLYTEILSRKNNTWRNFIGI